MQLENVYPKFFSIKLDAVIADEIDIELLTPKQIQTLYRNCVNYMKSFDNMTEIRYAKLTKKEYEAKERKYFEVEITKNFLSENFVEALI